MSSTSSDSLPPLTRPPQNGSITGDHDHDHETSEDEFETVVSKRTKQQQQKSRRYYKERHYHKPWAGGGKQQHSYNNNNNKNAKDNHNQSSHDHTSHHTHNHNHAPHPHGHHGPHENHSGTITTTAVINGHPQPHHHHHTSESEPEITNAMATTTLTDNGCGSSSTVSTSSPTSPIPVVEKFTQAPPPAVNPWKIHRNAAQVLVNGTPSNKPTPSTNVTNIVANAKPIDSEVKTLEPRTTAINISSKTKIGPLSPSASNKMTKDNIAKRPTQSPTTPQPPASKVTTTPANAIVPGPTPVSASPTMTDSKPLANNISTSHCSTNGHGHAKGWGKVPITLPVKANTSSADWPTLDEAVKVDPPVVLENGFGGGKGTSVRSSCSSSTCTGTGDSHSLDDEFGKNDLQAEESNERTDKGYASDEKRGTSTPTSKKSSKPKWVPLELEEPVQTKTDTKPRKKKFTNTNNNLPHHPNQNGYKNGSSHTSQMNGIEPNSSNQNHVDNHQHAPTAAASTNSQPARVNNSRPPFRNTRRNPNSNNNNHFHHNRGAGYHKNFNHHNSMERDFSQDFLPPPFPEFTPLQLEGFVMPYAGVLPLPGAGPVPPVGPLVDNQVLLQCVQNQIEYYLSEENLAKDFFLRRKMDSEGYIPISLISSFNRLRCLTMDPDIIIQAIQNSEHIEMVDGYIRPAAEPTKWPVPDIVTCKILAEQSFAHFPAIPCPITEHPSGTLTPSASTSTTHHHHTTHTRNFLLMLNEPRTRRNSM